jgi:hypothetical protein
VNADRIRGLIKEGRLADAVKAIAESGPFDGKALDAVELIRRDGFVGWKLAGLILFQAGSSLADIRSADRIWVEFGGISAAVGYVPITGLRERDGKTEILFHAGVDTCMSDESPEEIRDDLDAVFKAVARAAGARFVSQEEQFQEVQRLQEEEEARHRKAADAISIAPGQMVWSALTFGHGNAVVLRGPGGETVVVQLRSLPSQPIAETLRRNGVLAVDAAVTDRHRKELVPLLEEAGPVRRVIELDTSQGEDLGFGDVRVLARDGERVLVRIRVGSLASIFSVEATSEMWSKVSEADLACDAVMLVYWLEERTELPKGLRPRLVVCEGINAGLGWTPEGIIGSYASAGGAVGVAGIALVKSGDALRIIP